MIKFTKEYEDEARVAGIDNTYLPESFKQLFSKQDDWTCSCLYRCNDCIRLENEGSSKQEFFKTKDNDD